MSKKKKKLYFSFKQITRMQELLEKALLDPRNGELMAKKKAKKKTKKSAKATA